MAMNEIRDTSLLPVSNMLLFITLFSTSVELDSQNCLSVRPSGIFGWGASSEPFKVF